MRAMTVTVMIMRSRVLEAAEAAGLAVVCHGVCGVCVCV